MTKPTREECIDWLETMASAFPDRSRMYTAILEYLQPSELELPDLPEEKR